MYNLQRILLPVYFLLNSVSVIADIELEVEIKGVNTTLTENIRQFLSIEQQKNQQLFSTSRMHHLHKKATAEILNALKPFGYYRPKIKTQLLENSPNDWRAIYSIEPGRQLQIGVLDFNVSGEMKYDTALKKHKQQMAILQPGAAFDHRQYQDLKALLIRLATERGYFKGRFVESRVEINLDRYKADIYLHYDSGPRYNFGFVTLNQNVLKPAFLKRYIPFERGSPYTLGGLLDLQQALNDSDYFRIVEVSPGEPTAENREVPITVTLAPRKRHLYSFGIGYGTDTGVRTQLGWEMPRLNTRGHRFSTKLKYSEIGLSFTSHYRIPILNPRVDQIVYSAGIINQTTQSSDSTVRTIGASLQHSRGFWRESAMLNYQREEYIVADTQGESTMLLPSISWSRIWGRQQVYTRDGLGVKTGLRGAAKKLLSSSDFGQIQGDVKLIESIAGHNRIILRSMLGGTLTRQFSTLPSSMRFFAGGSQSIRGFPYQSLGPVNEQGKVIGGKHLIIGSIEFEHNFGPKWGTALFYDSGNAFNEATYKLEQGTGIGLRWQSPIGPVRTDIAVALSRQKRPWRLHINIGPDF